MLFNKIYKEQRGLDSLFKMSKKIDMLLEANVQNYGFYYSN